MVETCDKNVPNSTGFVPNTMPRPKQPFHLVADRTLRRRLQELQQVVTEELAAPYTVKFTAYKGDDTTIHGAACYLPDRIGHLYKCRPPPPSDIMQPGDRWLHWLPIAVDGTSRHEASYVHCTLGGTASPNQLSSWWLMGGSEKWETLYAASQEMDFDTELRKAAAVSFKDAEGNDRQSLFFLCADGKAQVLMAGCQNWKAESPGATVCWVCMRKRAVCLATFGTASAIDGN